MNKKSKYRFQVVVQSSPGCVFLAKYYTIHTYPVITFLNTDIRKQRDSEPTHRKFKIFYIFKDSNKNVKT